jgi:hypothetical protein
MIWLPLSHAIAFPFERRFLIFSRETGSEKNSENFRLFLPLVKNTYLTERPPARFFARIYGGFVLIKKWSS